MKTLARVLISASSWVRARRGWSAGLLAAAAGALAVLGHAPFFVWPAFAAAVLILFVLLDGTARSDRSLLWGLRAAAWRGWAFGFGYFLAGMSWVGNAFLVDAERFAALLPVAITALPAGLALFWAAAAVIWRALRREGAGRVLVFAGVFGLAEIARGHWFTGLPWNLPAYIWEPGGWMSQSGAVIGPYGVSILTLLVFAAPATLGDRRGKLVAGCAAALVVAALVYGATRLAGAGPVGAAARADAPLIAAGQGGFTQQEVWDPANRERIIARYLALLDDPNASRADVVVWPEGALPALLLEEPDIARQIDARLGDRKLVMGVLRRDMKPESGGGGTVVYYNSMAALDRASGGLAVTSLYDKHHLVPFGEYLPLPWLFGALGLESLVSVGSGFEPGVAPGILQVPGLPPADARICYEIIFPSFNPNLAAARARWIINVSVDAWYGQGLGPDQHYALARWRAIESGLPLVRSASGGWSAVVDPFGRAVAEHRNGYGYAVARLPESQDTVFSRSFLPPSVPFGALIFLIVGLLLDWRTRALTTGAQ